MSTLPDADAALLVRAKSLCNEAMFAVDLQHERLKNKTVADDVQFFHKWADIQFLIVALRRLRRAASIAGRVASCKPNVDTALAAFDAALPHLRTMRNVGEHIDDYANDSKARREKVARGELQVVQWDDSHVRWLGGELDFGVALDTASRLNTAIKELVKSQLGKP